MGEDHFLVFLVIHFDKVDNGTNHLKEFSNLSIHIGVVIGVGIKVVNELQLVNSLEVVVELGILDVSWDCGWVLGDIVIQLSFDIDHQGGNLTLI